MDEFRKMIAFSATLASPPNGRDRIAVDESPEACVTFHYEGERVDLTIESHALASLTTMQAWLTKEGYEVRDLAIKLDERTKAFIDFLVGRTVARWTR